MLLYILIKQAALFFRDDLIKCAYVLFQRKTNPARLALGLFYGVSETNLKYLVILSLGTDMTTSDHGVILCEIQ